MLSGCCGLGNPETENTIKGMALLESPRTGGLWGCVIDLPKDQILYDYLGKSYCILHLPLAEKRKLKLDNKIINDCFRYAIKAGCSNFNFISIEACSITMDNYNNIYSFVGAHLKNLSIGGSLAQGSIHFDFSASLIEGDNVIRAPLIYRCDFLKSVLYDRLIFEGCEITDNINFREAKILGRSYISNPSGIYFKKTKIQDFIFINTQILAPLCFEDSTVDNLDIRKSKFLIPPSLYKTDVKRLTLPQKKRLYRYH